MKRIFGYYSNHRARIQRISREGGWIIVGQVASILGTLVLVRILTEYLQPAEYGKLALALTIAGFVNQVVMGGLVSGIARFYPIAVERGDLMGYLQASCRLLLYASGSVFSLALSFIFILWFIGMHHWLWLLLAVVIFSTLCAYNSAFSSIQSAARQRAVVALHTGTEAWLKIGMTMVLILCFGTNATVVVIGYAGSALIVAISQLFFFRRLIDRQDASLKHRQDENWSRQIWTFSWPFCTWGTFTWLQQVSDRFALDHYATESDIGLYVAVFQLGYVPIGLLTSFLITLIGPILYQRAGSARNADRNAGVQIVVWRITLVSLGLTLAGFIFTWALHGWIFRWIVGADFRSASYLLPWVVLAGGIFSTAQVLALKLVSELRTADLTTPKITTALLGVTANLLGARYYGVDGVVSALVFFSAIYLCWIILIVKKLKTATA